MTAGALADAPAEVGVNSRPDSFTCSEYQVASLKLTRAGRAGAVIAARGASADEACGDGPVEQAERTSPARASAAMRFMCVDLLLAAEIFRVPVRRQVGADFEARACVGLEVGEAREGDHLAGHAFFGEEGGACQRRAVAADQFVLLRREKQHSRARPRALQHRAGLDVAAARTVPGVDIGLEGEAGFRL